MAIRTDDIGFNGYKLFQDDEAFCYGVDAVLLADFALARHSDKVIDLGSGSGVIPFILYAKYSPKSIVGVEIQKWAFDLAEKGAMENSLSDRVMFVNSDVANVGELFDEGSFDLVTSNPPYMESGRGPVSPNKMQHIARTETTASLYDFMNAAAYLLKKGGRLCMVHRPSRLADLFDYGRRLRLEPKRIRMVCPRSGENANIVLIEFVKYGGKELTVLPELIVRSESGFTDEIERIYNRK